MDIGPAGKAREIADEMRGVDIGSHSRHIAGECDDDVGNFVLGRIEACQNPAAVHPFLGGHGGAQGAHGTVVDLDLVLEEGAEGWPILRVQCHRIVHHHVGQRGSGSERLKVEILRRACRRLFSDQNFRPASIEMLRVSSR